MREIKSLIDRAKRYIRSAEILLKEGDYESSVSRTYYAMFYCAQAMLLTRNMSFSSHKGVISAFGEHFVKTGVFLKKMGRKLNRAFEKRQLGDYEYTFVISKMEAEEMLESGRKFVDKIVQHLKEKKIIQLLNIAVYFYTIHSCRCFIRRNRYYERVESIFEDFHLGLMKTSGERKEEGFLVSARLSMNV